MSESVSRFSSVPGVTVKKSVFKKKLYERVLSSSIKKVNSRSKISARVLKCEDVEFVIIRDSN
jgi:hypothetical protein